MKIPWRRAWQPTPVFLPGESSWTEKPGGPQSMGSQRVRHHWVTNHIVVFFFFFFNKIFGENISCNGLRQEQNRRSLGIVVRNLASVDTGYIVEPVPITRQIHWLNCIFPGLFCITHGALALIRTVTRVGEILWPDSPDCNIPTSLLTHCYIPYLQPSLSSA